MTQIEPYGLLEDSWEHYRYKVSLLEKQFLSKNKEKYSSYFELKKALDRYLKKVLRRERELLLNAQVSKKILHDVL